MADRYVLRPLEAIEDFRACVALQEETWGNGFSERVPLAILKVAAALGGVSAGAYDADRRLVGFVFGMTGIREGELVHWSDMLAVRPEARDTGLGERLKRYQREQVSRLGVRKMFWTFDPLRGRNAHLNLTKLGAVAREYVPDMYGETDSPLHTGVGTDRLLALWLLDSERVLAHLAGERPRPDQGFPPADADRALDNAPGMSNAGHPRPAALHLDLEAPRILVSIPTDIDSIMRADMGLARSWREATREAFQHYLARGYEASEFVRGPATSQYVLTPVSSAPAEPPASRAEPGLRPTALAGGRRSGR